MNPLAVLLALNVASASLSIETVIGNSSKTIPMNGRKDGKPLRVYVGMYIESIGNFRSSEMSFDVDLYLYTSWKDRRLAHNKSDHVLVNDKRILDQIWLPDLYFANARSSTLQYVTVPNFSLFVARDGTISYSLRATCSISCALNLVDYPMDRQQCYIQVVSYGHVAEKMTVKWFTANPVRHNDGIGLPEFGITGVTSSYCNGTYRYAISEKAHKLGTFSCLNANIYLSRSIGYNLVQSYIPTGLIVCISWVSFWIDRRAVPARVTLSFTTLVSLTTLGNGLRYDLPQVSYAKAIDLWYGACLLFVFLALVEFAVINSYMRKCDKYGQLSRRCIGMPRKRTGAPPMKIMEHIDPRESALKTKVVMGSDGMTFTNGIEHRRVKFHSGANPESKGFIERKEESPLKEKMAKPAIQLFMCEDNEGIPVVHAAPRSRANGHLMKSGSNASTDSPPSKESISSLEFMDSEDCSPVHDERHYIGVSLAASRRALLIDKICRFAFPFAFFVFNFSYWSYYYKWSLPTHEPVKN